MRPACSGSRRAPIGGSGAGGSPEGMIAGSDGMGGMRELQVKCVRAAGRRVDALPAAYVPTSHPLQRPHRGTDRSFDNRRFVWGLTHVLGRYRGHGPAAAQARTH